MCALESGIKQREYSEGVLYLSVMIFLAKMRNRAQVRLKYFDDRNWSNPVENKGGMNEIKGVATYFILSIVPTCSLIIVNNDICYY